MGGTVNKRLTHGYGYYRCRHCGTVVIRESKKWWIPGWCDIHQRDVRIIRISKPNG